MVVETIHPIFVKFSSKTKWTAGLTYFKRTPMRTNVRFKRFVNSIFIWRRWKPNSFNVIKIPNVPFICKTEISRKNETNCYRWLPVWKTIFIKRRRFRRAVTEITFFFYKNPEIIIIQIHTRKTNRRRDNNHRYESREHQIPFHPNLKKNDESICYICRQKKFLNCFNNKKQKTKKNYTRRFGKQC